MKKIFFSLIVLLGAIAAVADDCIPKVAVSSDWKLAKQITTMERDIIRDSLYQILRDENGLVFVDDNMQDSLSPDYILKGEFKSLALSNVLGANGQKECRAEEVFTMTVQNPHTDKTLYSETYTLVGTAQYQSDARFNACRNAAPFLAEFVAKYLAYQVYVYQDCSRNCTLYDYSLVDTIPNDTICIFSSACTKDTIKVIVDSLSSLTVRVFPYDDYLPKWRDNSMVELERGLLNIDGNAEYYIDWLHKPDPRRKYLVTFLNNDKSVLKSDYIEEGRFPIPPSVEPVYNMGDPAVKSRAAQKKFYHKEYIFLGWCLPSDTSKLVGMSPVSKPVTYMAKYREEKEKFTITFVDSDDKILIQYEEDYGKTPAYPGNAEELSHSESDGMVKSYFDKWSPELEPAKRDMTYKAQYEKKALVRFLNDDKEVLLDAFCSFNITPKPPVVPPHPDKNGYRYQFTGWSPELVPVKGPQIYIAKYDSVKIGGDLKPVDESLTDYDCGEVELQMVDLGLSVKWANMNVGSAAINDIGSYFAWGEIRTKDEYDFSTYAYGEESSINKYNHTDGLTRLQPEDDVAHVKLGEGWRIPTAAEWKELMDNCEVSIVSIFTMCKGEIEIYPFKAVQFKSKINEECIYFPIMRDSAYKGKDFFEMYIMGNKAVLDCAYWSSDLYDRDCRGASAFVLYRMYKGTQPDIFSQPISDKIYKHMQIGPRDVGLPIRAVHP